MSRLRPTWRWVPLMALSAITAYLSRWLGRDLGAFAEAAASRDLPEPEIMRSSGGVAPWREAARQGAPSAVRQCVRLAVAWKAARPQVASPGMPV